jgi:hypothetical protein
MKKVLRFVEKQIKWHINHSNARPRFIMYPYYIFLCKLYSKFAKEESK